MTRFTFVVLVIVIAISLAAFTALVVMGTWELKRNGVPRHAVDRQAEPVRFKHQPARDHVVIPRKVWDGRRAAASAGENGKVGQPAEEDAAGAAAKSDKADAVAVAGDRQHYPGGFQPYCDSPQERDDSDLCAQWAAVHEVATGNGIGRSGLIFQFLGLVVSLFVGVLGVIGLVVAARAAELASKAVKAASNAERGFLVFAFESRAGDGQTPRFGAWIDNLGATPAIVERAGWRQAMSRPGLHERAVVLDPVPVTLAGGKSRPMELPNDVGPWILLCLEYRDVFGTAFTRTDIFECIGPNQVRCRGQSEAER